jgi:hypothetical protein
MPPRQRAITSIIEKRSITSSMGMDVRRSPGKASGPSAPDEFPERPAKHLARPQYRDAVNDSISKVGMRSLAVIQPLIVEQYTNRAIAGKAVEPNKMTSSRFCQYRP